MTSMGSSRAAEIQKMVFIDSTWPQAKQIFKDQRLRGKRLDAKVPPAVVSHFPLILFALESLTALRKNDKKMFGKRVPFSMPLFGVIS